MTPLSLAMLLMAAGRGGRVLLSDVRAVTDGDVDAAAKSLAGGGFGRLSGGEPSHPKGRSLRLTKKGAAMAAALLAPSALAAVPMVLRCHGTATPAELATAAGCTPRRVRQVLTEMERRGEAVREPGKPSRWRTSP